MAYRVPDDEVVLDAARAVLRSAKSIVSQRELRKQVLAQLRESDKQLTVGGERVRRLLAMQSFARIELRARKGPKEKILTRCPVCDSKLERVKNQTLFGGDVTLALRCPTCHYWSGKEKRIPTLYIFHYQGTNEGRATPLAPDPRKPF